MANYSRFAGQLVRGSARHSLRYGQIHNTVRFPNLNLDNSVPSLTWSFPSCVTLARCMWVKAKYGGLLGRSLN